MRCSSCNTIIESGTVFCPECGQKIIEQKREGKSFRVMSDYEVHFGEKEVKYFSNCRVLEDQAQKDILAIKKHIDSEKNGNFFLPTVCCNIIPSIGDAVEKQIKLADSVLKDNNIIDYSERLLWEKVLYDDDLQSELYDCFYAATVYLEDYFESLANLYPNNHGFYSIRNLRLYRVQCDAVKSKNYPLYFRAYKDICEYYTIQTYNRAVALYNDKKEYYGQILKDLRISESKNESFEFAFGLALKEFWAYENRISPSSVQLDTQTCDSIYTMLRKEALSKIRDYYMEELLNSYNIINKVKEILTKIIVSKLINKDRFDQIINNKRKAKEKFKSMSKNMNITDKIDGLCQCIELDPYCADYYEAIYSTNQESRQDLIAIADYVGSIQFVKQAFHEELNESSSCVDSKITRKVDTEEFLREGNRYLNGEGVEKNIQKALEWFIKGAEAGNALCQYNAGYIYSSDLLGSPDYVKCKYWFIRAAENGVAEAINYLDANKDFFATIDSN